MSFYVYLTQHSSQQSPILVVSIIAGVLAYSITDLTFAIIFTQGASIRVVVAAVPHSRLTCAAAVEFIYAPSLDSASPFDLPDHQTCFKETDEVHM